jgi:succinyl-CoA synthetase beta subunit
VEPAFSFETEYYLAIVIDPEEAMPVLLFSPSGGVEVESTQRLARIPLRPDGTLPAAAFRRKAYALEVPSQLVEKLVPVARSLASAFAAWDAQLVELNPLAVSMDGELRALDARLIVDDNALFRQPELKALIASMRPRHLEDMVRDETRLEYVRLGGSLGLISGGAGLTMATMDVIADAGATAACFLDCSANPTRHGYGHALDLMLDDPTVAAVLISIFGGLTQVDRVARNLTQLLSEKNPMKPVTFRLMGTNVEQAEEILQAAGWVNYRTVEDAVAAAVATLPQMAAHETVL